MPHSPSPLRSLLSGTCFHWLPNMRFCLTSIEWFRLLLSNGSLTSLVREHNVRNELCGPHLCNNNNSKNNNNNNTKFIKRVMLLGRYRCSVVFFLLHVHTIQNTLYWFVWFSRFEVVFAQHHRSSVVHGCRLSATELFQSLLLPPQPLPGPLLCLERTTTPRHVCTVPSASFMAVVSRLIFLAIPLPTFSSACSVTCVRRQFVSVTYLLTYLPASWAHICCAYSLLKPSPMFFAPAPQRVARLSSGLDRYRDGRPARGGHQSQY